MRPRSRWLVPLIVLAFGGVAPAAHAVTIVSYNGTQGLVVTGDDATNLVSVTGSASGYAVNISPGQAFSFGGCTQLPQNPSFPDTTSFDCPATGTRAATVNTAAANDGVNIRGAVGDVVNANLGDGNDDYSSLLSEAAVTADGGNGNDEFIGSKLNDTLRGGPDRDTFFGHAGTDTIQGGDGDDQFDAYSKPSLGSFANEEVPPAPDVMDGGPGVDEISYIFTQEQVNVSLDGIANDGRVGENDNAINIENVVGGKASNTITGNGLANRVAVSLLPVTLCCPATTAPPAGDDVIHGGDGDDFLSAGAGNDQIFGEGGNDIIFGGSQSDMIDGGGGVDDLRDEFQGGTTAPGGPQVNNDPSTSSSSLLTPGDDVLFGGPGNDFISTREGTDTTHGNDGDDIIRANAQNAGATGPTPETVFGDNDNDDIVGSGTATTPIRIEGNDGNDEIHGAGMTIEIGGIGDDKILNLSGSGPDVIEGNSGNDIIESGQGDDQVNGGTGADTIGNLIASGSSAGSDTIFGGPGADNINTQQSTPNAFPATADTVDCGRNLPRRDDDGDSLIANLIDTAKDCENVTFTPANEHANVFVPKQTLAVPRHGDVLVEVHCLRKRATRSGCKGTIRLGSLARSGHAGPLGPKQHFQIPRGETATLDVPILAAARARLRNISHERGQVEIVQPGDKGPHTTIRALQAKKE